MSFPIDNVAARSLALILTAFLAACGSDDDDASVSVDPGGQIDVSPPDDGVPVSADPSVRIDMPPPEAVLAVPGMDVDALDVAVRIGDTTLAPVRRGEVWQASTTLPEGESALVDIVWSERFAGAPLPLASLSREIGPFTADAQVEIGAGGYDGAGFDADADGVSNLDERRVGTGPLDGDDPGFEVPAGGDPGDAGSGEGGPADEGTDTDGPDDGASGGAPGEGEPGDGTGTDGPDDRTDVGGPGDGVSDGAPSDGTGTGGTDDGEPDDNEPGDDGTNDCEPSDGGTSDGGTNDGTGDGEPGSAGTGDDGEPGQGPPPRSPEVPGGRPPVSIFPFDPAAGTPVIDGGFDEAWSNATFSDEAGGSLLIDRLLVDQGAEAADGGVPYIWFAMHDFEFLYLFVQFERAEPYTPFRDSERFFDDDAVNLFFDGDASRGERLEGVDGGDDRYVAIPLLAREGEERPEAFAPFGELAPEVPPSLEYGVCVCDGSVTGWELKIALSDLNIEVGRPFGFEVQLDQDLDGGERDSRWGWSNPAPAMGGTFVPESPALSGTVTLRAERLP